MARDCNLSGPAPVAIRSSVGLRVDTAGRRIGVPTNERFDREKRDSASRFRPVHLATLSG